MAAGSGLWLLTAAAISARTGTGLLQLSGAAAGGAAAAAADAVGASPLSGLLFGELLQRPGDVGQWALVLLTSALSPAGETQRHERGRVCAYRHAVLGVYGVGGHVRAGHHVHYAFTRAFTVWGVGWSEGILIHRLPHRIYMTVPLPCG